MSRANAKETEWVRKVSRCQFLKRTAVVTASAVVFPIIPGDILGANGWVHINRGSLDTNPTSLLMHRLAAMASRVSEMGALGGL